MAMALDCRNLSKNVTYVIQYYQSLLGGGGEGGGSIGGCGTGVLQ